MLFKREDAGGTPWRAGRLLLPRGEIATPVFMPVGTQASVKTLSSQELVDLGAGLILANTYHLHLRPGSQLIEQLGGLHGFMGWPGSILTDSGGFQVFSLQDLCTVTEQGVSFRSHLDGTPLSLTPEEVVAIQLRLGSDIIMPLDECVGYPADRERVAAAMYRSMRWAARAKACAIPEGHFLFGIVQGGMFPELRAASAAALSEIGFPGYAIGGLSVGETNEQMVAMVAATTPCLPASAPRYLMGVGTPVELWHAVERGVDMFDCVLPTRNARNASLFTQRGPINMKNARFADDAGPVDEACDCYCCRHHSRAYLRHLFKSGELLAKRLASIHNLRFLVRMMAGMREAIMAGRFIEAQKAFLEHYARGESTS